MVIDSGIFKCVNANDYNIRDLIFVPVKNIKVYHESGLLIYLLITCGVG